MKTVGAGIVLLASFSCGWTSLREEQARLCCLRAMLTSLQLMRAQLRSNRTSLSKLCLELAEKTESSAAGFYRCLEVSLSRLGETGFEKLWADAVETKLPRLDETDRAALKELGKHLGRFALEEQIKAIDRSMTLLSESLERRENRYREEKKLRLWLPTATGALLVILLL